MILETAIRCAGALQLFLAALHLGFPRRFAWREELARLSLLNRQMFIVHTLFIVLVIALFGALSLFAPDTLVTPSRLGGFVVGGLEVFWLARLLCQWFVYDAQLWRGQRFNTAMHVLFTACWMFLCVVYALALARQYAPIDARNG